MARTVYVPEAGGALDFPDGTSDQQIVDFVRAKYAPKPAPAPPEAGIGALESGFYGALGRAEAAGGKAAQGLGIDWLASDLFERSRASTAYAEKYKPDVASVTDIQGVGDAAKFAGSTIAQSAPETAVGLAGAYAGAATGAAIGSVVPGPGTAVGGVVGGIVGGAIASLPFFIGGNIQAQAREQGIPLEETSGYAASVGAAAQAPLDAAFDTLIARKFPGAGAALDVVKKGFLKEVATTAGKAAVTEALTEPAQQAIEIAQANPSKLLEFSPDVQNELLNAAAAGALAGGVIGGAATPVARAAQGIAESRAEAPQRQLKEDITTASVAGQRLKRNAEINAGIEGLAAQPSISSLRLSRKRLEPTPENGLKAPLDRVQILDEKNNTIAEFGDVGAATQAVSEYNRLSGKKIPLQRFDAKTNIAQKVTPPATSKVKIPTAPEVQAAAPDVTSAINPFGEGLKNSKIFKTALGSQYSVHADGSTTRFKTPHPGHDPKDVGLKPKSQRTFYIRPEDAANLSLVQAQGLKGTPVIHLYKPGVVGVRILDGSPEGNKFVSGTLTKIFDQPAVGLTPVEIWNDGAGHHFGNKITEITDPPISEPVQTPATEDTVVGAINAPEAVTESLSDAAKQDVAAASQEAPQPIEPAPIEVATDVETAPPIVDSTAQEQIRKVIQDRKEKIATGVRDALNRYNLKDVQTKFVPSFLDAMGKVRAAEGTESIDGDKSFVTLASGIYDPKFTTEEMVNKVIDAMNHETIHSVFDLGLIRPVEKQVLFNAVSTAKVPGKKYTYLDYAKAIYDPTKPGFEAYADPDVVAEEAVAEMFRDWRKRGAGAPSNTRGLFNRLIESLRSIFNTMRRNRYEDVFSDIETGKVGLRERAPVKETKEKMSIYPDNPSLSVAPVYPYGQRVPQVNASDTDRVIDSLDYGAIVTKVDDIFKSRTFSFIPERWRPSPEGVTEFVQKWADRILPVGQMIDFVKQNGGTVPDALDVYSKAQRSISITSENLKNREVDLYEPLTKFMKENGITRGELGRYMYALHAPERNARIRAITPPKKDRDGNIIPLDPAFGSGMSDKKAADIVQEIESGPKAAQFAQAREMVRRIIDDTNQLRVDSGLTPDYETVTTTIKTEDGQTVTLEPYKNYVPVRGFEDESAVDGDVSKELKARIGQGFKIKGREDLRAFGRTSEANNEDILPHILLQNQEAVVRAEKNKVGLSFLGLIEENPEILEDYGVKILTAETKPMRKYVNSRGIVKTMVDPMYKNSDDVFVVKKDGIEIPIKIDNRLLQKALITHKSADPGSNSKFVRFLGRLNRILAAANTVYNPEFALVNFPRDLQQAILNITQYEIDGIKTKILKDAMPAAWNVWQILRDPKAKNEWSDIYAQFKADGGSTSGFYGAFSLEEQIKKLERMTMDPSNSPTARAKDAILWVGKVLEDYNGAFENAIRLSVYKNLIDKKVSREKAAFIAKNITVNFDQRGEFGPIMNSLYLFYNASVQGTMTLLTAAARSRKVQAALGGLVFFGFMQDLINSKMSQGEEDDDPLYDKIPDYKLENNIILMDPFGITDKGYIAIPLAYGANAFVNLGRAMSRNIRGGYTTGEAATSIGSTFIDAFNPVGGTESLLNFIAPSAGDPIVALWLNMDYSGRKIYPTAFPGSIPKADSQTYFSSTSPTAISVAQFLNKATGGSEYIPGYISIHPDTIEYVYDYILGAAGATARRVVDTAMNDVPKVLEGDWSNIEINNVPVFRKVYGNVSERMSFEDYFEKVNHVLTRGEELKFAIKEGDPARVREVRQKYADELKIYPAIKALANRRNKLAAELRKVRENEKMPPEQKRRRQEILQKQIEEITNRVDKLYGKQIGDKYPGLFS